MTPLRVLARLWLAEPDDDVLAALRDSPSLSAHVPAGGDDAARLDLAVAWLDLVGRRVPPHESVFVDPSAMLDAPATARFRATLAAAGWSPPPGLRVPAVDQLGVQLLALADLGERGRAVLTDHLLVWLPLFADAITHAAVHPLYEAAARATLDAVLALGDELPADALPAGAAAVLPSLPARPTYRANDGGQGVVGIADGVDADTEVDASPDDPLAGTVRLRDVLDALLYPRDAGLYLTRDDVRACMADLNLPVGMGDRRMMLRGAFEAAGRHDAVVPLLDALDQRWAAAESGHAGWASAHPAWATYASAWGERLGATRAALSRWRAAARGP